MQANGLDERFNQTLQQMLVKFKKNHWDDFLDSCLYAYNTARQQSSKYTPFELMFSRKAILPVDFPIEKKEVDRIVESLPERLDG